MSKQEATLRRLQEVLRQRRAADGPEGSYTVSLYRGGLEAILRKVGEEAVETILAANKGSRPELIAETADLWYHLMVMLVYLDLDYEDVLAELERRMAHSPHAPND